MLCFGLAHVHQQLSSHVVHTFNIHRFGSSTGLSSSCIISPATVIGKSVQNGRDRALLLKHNLLIHLRIICLNRLRKMVSFNDFGQLTKLTFAYLYSE